MKKISRKEALDRLKILKLKIEPPEGERLGWLETFLTKEDMQAIDMAFNSLKIDEMYQLEFENVSDKELEELAMKVRDNGITVSSIISSNPQPTMRHIAEGFFYITNID